VNRKFKAGECVFCAARHPEQELKGAVLMSAEYKKRERELSGISAQRARNRSAKTQYKSSPLKALSI
jgi:hypothetical protein